MNIEQARAVLARNAAADANRFYAGAVGLALGRGLIYDDIVYPVFDDATSLYATLAGVVVVLTHECDVDPANERMLNEHVLICPIIPIEQLVELLDELPEPEAYKLGFLGNLAARNIYRLIYLPPRESFPNGAVVYLNQITHSHVACFRDDAKRPICTLTAIGLREIEYALENHLLRPKADRLPLAPHRA